MVAPNDRGRRHPIPYGPLYAVPASLTFFGLIFYHIAAFSCNTFVTSYNDSLGYFRVEYIYTSQGCGNFKAFFDQVGYEFKSTWKFGRFIGVVGALLAWVVFFAVGAAAFVKYPHPAKRYISMIAGCMGALAFFSLLLLVGLSEGFSLGGAGYMAIISAFVWAGAAVSMFYCMKERLPPPPPETVDSENPPTADEKMNSTNNAYGGVPVTPVVPMNNTPPVSVSEGAVNVQDYEDEFIGGDDTPSLVSPEVMKQRIETPVAPVSQGGWNVQEYDDEVIEDAPSLVLLEQRENRIDLGGYEEEPLVDQGEPEIRLDEEEEDPQIRLGQAEPEGVSVIKMDYEAKIPAAPQPGASDRNRKPLEP